MAVVLEGVIKTYRSGAGVPVRALDAVNLEVAPGEAVAIAGPSGSGKSTLLHLVGAMDTPDSGTLKVGEWDLTRMRDKDRATFRRQVGFVFQRFHLLPALSAVG